jgi:hypothetical protein
MFTREFLQAVSDWQRGGDENQKTRRGERLKELAESIDQRFQQCAPVTYHPVGRASNSYLDETTRGVCVGVTAAIAIVELTVKISRLHVQMLARGGTATVKTGRNEPQKGHASASGAMGT